MSFDDRSPASSAALYTAPADHVRQFDLTVRVPLRPQSGYLLSPWVRIVANTETDDVTIAAGIKVIRHSDDDGA